MMAEVLPMNIPGDSAVPINLTSFEKDTYEYDSVEGEDGIDNNKSSANFEVASQSSDPFDDESDNESIFLEEHSIIGQRRSVSPIDTTLARGTNPFDSVASVEELPGVAIEEEIEIETEDQVEIDTEEQVETLDGENGNIEFLVVTNINEQTVTSVSEQQVTSLMERPSLKRCDSDDTDDTDDTAPESGVSSGVSAENYLADSAKSLLKKAGERLEYQQRSDEIRNLRSDIETMKQQGEAMSEQLRRSMDTKNDLVIAQQELERYHEKCLSTKDIELNHLKAFVRRLTDKQAENELGFMNEISSLSKEISSLTVAQNTELAEKDHSIDQLEKQVKSLGAALVRGKEIVCS
jgi:hypothetical protein